MRPIGIRRLFLGCLGRRWISIDYELNTNVQYLFLAGQGKELVGLE